MQNTRLLKKQSHKTVYRLVSFEHCVNVFSCTFSWRRALRLDSLLIDVWTPRPTWRFWFEAWNWLFVLIACGRMLFVEHEVWNNANILVWSVLLFKGTLTRYAVYACRSCVLWMFLAIASDLRIMQARHLDIICIAPTNDFLNCIFFRLRCPLQRPG